MTPMRETAFESDSHPTHLTISSPVGNVFLSHWEQPALAKVVEGDSAKGWEGDPRLAWYWDGQEQRGVLVRREHDGEYRTVLATAQYPIGYDEMANRIVDKLIEQDVRRGYDPKKAVDAHNAKVDAEQNYRASQRNQQFAEKLAWGLRKDLGAHL